MPEHLKPSNWPVAIGLGILRLACSLPFPFNIRIGKWLGRTLYRIPSSRRQVTKVNVDLCFPELNDAEKEQLCRRVFENYGAGLIESAMSWWWPKDKINALVEVEGLEIFQQVKAEGKGVLLLGAHFSTLDFGGAMAAKYIESSIVYRPQRQPLFNYTIKKGRARYASSSIESTQLRSLIKLLKKGESVWYAPDQDEGEENSVFAPFFGQTAATLKATTTLSRMTGARVVMYGHRRKEDDSGYIATFTGPLENFPSGDDVKDATAVNNILEQQIRLAPSQYYWVHRRFKTQPNLQRGALYR